VGIASLKINICQRFKYQKNRAVSKVLLVFETWTGIDFQGDFPLFEMKTKMRQLLLLGYFQKKILHAYAYLTCKVYYLLCEIGLHYIFYVPGVPKNTQP